MRQLLDASRVLAMDLASTLLFLAILATTGSLIAAVASGMALGIAQIGHDLWRGKRIEALQWLSLIIIVVSGSATFVTDDPLFVMLKPTVIYAVVGCVMLRRGWMTRYLPPIAQHLVPDLGVLFGYIWAGLMFGSAVLNIVLALLLEPAAWAAWKSAWAIGSKVALFLIQYAIMKTVGIRRARRAMAAST